MLQLSLYLETIRLPIFIGILSFFIILESIFKKKPRTAPIKKRWSQNLMLSFLNSFILKWLVPFSVITSCVWAEKNKIGFFNTIEISILVKSIISILVLDLLIYFQHRLFHIVPFFWRFHKVHHSDLNLDASSAVRFHTIEIIISFGIKLGSMIILGIPAIAGIIFEIILNSASIFNHSNLKIPALLDKYLRYIIVTPDMHRIHHSTNLNESNSNYSFNFPWWDKLFNTYTHEPMLGQNNMIIGLKEHQNEKPLKFIWILFLPFLKENK